MRECVVSALWDNCVKVAEVSYSEQNNLNGGYGVLQNNNNNKVKFTLEQATKAQRGSRGIALLFP
jgi:hypothetical protein